MLKVYVPRDTTAFAVGADRVAEAIESAAARQAVDLELVRNGSRGLFWLEPLVEVERQGARLGFGPVLAHEAESLLECLQDDPAAHPKHQGPVRELPYLKDQQRLTFARAGEGDPLSLDTYASLGGFEGLSNALRLTPQEIVAAVAESGLRGRGGAAFPAGIKWQTVLDAQSEQKYVVCNADEGDSGTFADRLLMEADPYQLIEGMVIAGLAVGAMRGYVYLRSEYPRAREVLSEAIARAEQAGYLGEQIRGSDQAF
ncbi:MAG: formate dehydrogenase, partial [Pseudomonadales bacterium]